MDLTQHTGSEQMKLWNGPAGHAWIEAQAVLDLMFKPFEDMLADAVLTTSAKQVLDVGCGTGSTTIATALQTGPGGSSVGIDISAPMIGTARLHAERDGSQASFICADAQTYPFEPARFDMIISRFGVMFFDDPVQAFINLRHAARNGAELRFVAWRSAAENPFMTAAERAAAPLLPNLPARRPGVPGQFAFAEPDRIARILADSGWCGIDIQPVDVACAFPETELLPYLSLLGPVGLLLRDADEATRTQVVNAVRSSFQPYVHGAEVRYTAACWMVTARAPEVRHV